MGLILVFDLDQTIVNTEAPGIFPGPEYPMNDEYKTKLKEQINPNVLDILLRAAKLRRIGVDAIFLLTNNSSSNYVANINALLLELSNNSIGDYKKRKSPFITEDIPGTNFFFDYIMTANHPSRSGLSKSSSDIEYMMSYMGMSMSIGDLFSRLYFFDDSPDHQIRKDLKNYSQGKYFNHYIIINPPFSTEYDDLTEYGPIDEALKKIETSRINVVVEGGKRSKRIKKNKIKTKKQSKRNNKKRSQKNKPWK